MQKITGKEIKIRMDDSFLDELDRIAKRMKMPRNRVIRILLEHGVDLYANYEAIGVWRLQDILTRTKNKVKESTDAMLFKITGRI